MGESKRPLRKRSATSSSDTVSGSYLSAERVGCRRESWVVRTFLGRDPFSEKQTKELLVAYLDSDKVAWVYRTEYRVSPSSIPNSRISGLKCRRRRLVLKSGFPFLLGKMSSQGPPKRRTCCPRCSWSSSSNSSGKEIERTLPLIFGACNDHPPPLRCR